MARGTTRQRIDALEMVAALTLGQLDQILGDDEEAINSAFSDFRESYDGGVCVLECAPGKLSAMRNTESIFRAARRSRSLERRRASLGAAAGFCAVRIVRSGVPKRQSVPCSYSLPKAFGNMLPIRGVPGEVTAFRWNFASFLWKSGDWLRCQSFSPSIAREPLEVAAETVRRVIQLAVFEKGE
jgi:hypothetical protein